MPFWNCKVYKGPQWSKSKSKRKIGEGKEGVGPGAYDLSKECCKTFSEQDEYYRSLAKQFSFVPRYIEAQELRAIAEVINLVKLFVYTFIKDFICTID